MTTHNRPNGPSGKRAIDESKRRAALFFAKRSRIMVGLLAIALVGAGCGTTARTSTGFDSGADFSRFHTYSWRNGTSAANGEVDKRIVDAVNRELQRKGLLETESGGDLAVLYHVSFERRLDIVAQDYLDGPYWRDWTRLPYAREVREIREIPEGTLVIDLVDARRNQLVWRGISVAELERDEEDLDRNIGFVTAEMFEDYPPEENR
ncbi:MAG: DUF4136 domain-containing protein [Longimicrobiales bacterium]